MRRKNRGVFRASVVCFLLTLTQLFVVQLSTAAPTASSRKAATSRQRDDGNIRITLSNGLRVLIVPARSSHVALVLRVGAGFLDEIPNADHALDETGVSHELEHALFRGTKAHPSKAEFIRALNSIGAMYNASTSFNRTNYFIVSSSQKFKDAAKIQSDMIAEPLLSDENFRSEARPVAEELRRNVTNPYSQLYQYSIMLHGLPDRLEIPMASTPERTLGHSPEVIRGFYNRYYSADNMTLAIVGDVGNIEETKKYLEQVYGRIPRFNVDRKVHSEFTSAVNPGMQMFKVASVSGTKRLANISFTLPYSKDLEGAASILSQYFERDGIDGALRPLINNGYVKDIYSSYEVYGTQMVFRFMLEITETGERNFKDVLSNISESMGQLKQKGLSDIAIQELSRHIDENHVAKAGILRLAERISDGIAQEGLNEATSALSTHKTVTADTLKSLASQMSPEKMEITMLTPSTVGEVERKDISLWQAQLVKKFNTPELTTPSETRNPFLVVSAPRVVRSQGMELTVVPEASARKEGYLELRLDESENPMALSLAFHAFKTDPQNLTLIRQMHEAGIELDFDLDDRNLVLRFEGDAVKISLALEKFVTAFRDFQISEDSFRRSVSDFLNRYRNIPASDVASMAINFGLSMIGRTETGAPRRSYSTLNEYSARLVKALLGIRLQDAQAALTTLKENRMVSGLLVGNWEQGAIDFINTQFRPKRPIPHAVEQHSAALPEGLSRQLVIRETPYDHQGVARVIPLAVQKYSNEYWMMKIFASILDERLDQTVRTERGLVYAVSAGFTANPEGGSSLYMMADSSHSAVKLAMSYTVVLEEMLINGVTDEEFESARRKVLSEVNREAQGVSGLYDVSYRKFNVKMVSLQLALLKKEAFSQSVARLMPSLTTMQENQERLQIDSVVAGRTDPSCARLLTSKR